MTQHDKPLTTLERRALHMAAGKGGVTIIQARTAKGHNVTAALAARLCDRGWATRHGDTLLITKQGRAKLAQPLPPAKPVYLRRRDGLTTREDQKVREEDEVQDVREIHGDWSQRAQAFHRLSMADSDATRLSGLASEEERLAELKRMAAEQGTDISSNVGVIRRQLAAIERKVSRSEEAA